MKSNIAKRGICIIAVSVLAACAQFGKQAPLEEPTVYSLPMVSRHPSFKTDGGCN